MLVGGRRAANRSFSALPITGYLTDGLSYSSGTPKECNMNRRTASPVKIPPPRVYLSVLHIDVMGRGLRGGAVDHFASRISHFAITNPKSSNRQFVNSSIRQFAKSPTLPNPSHANFI
jgi:hypothetical protein